MNVSHTVVEAVQRGVRVADGVERLVAVGDDRPQRHWQLTDSEWAQMTEVFRRVSAALGAPIPQPSMSDGEARFCATRWYGAMTDALYALSSTGAVVSGVFAEIQHCEQVCGSDYAFGEYERQAESDGQARAFQAQDLRQLRELREYVAFHGPRGPQIGWLDQF